MDSDTMKLGLLMETAQSQQKLVDASLDRLAEHTRGLDDVVRDQVRRTLVEELHDLGEASARAVAALHALRRTVDLRAVLWSVCMAAVAAGCAWAALTWSLPSRAEIDSLRVQRAQLATNIARLQRLGGSIDLRRCGEAARMCVHIDRSAPAYGARSDYYVLKGY